MNSFAFTKLIGLFEYNIDELFISFFSLEMI